MSRCSVLVLVLCSVFSALLTQDLTAQVGGDGRHGAYAPTKDTTLSTNSNAGVWQFTSIHVPKGVTVTLAGSNAARLFATGNITIEGTVIADGATAKTKYGAMGGPGGWAGGLGVAGPSYPYHRPTYGQPGSGPGGGAGGYANWNQSIFYGPGGAASHATGPKAYGAAYPFSVQGGSGGGGAASIGGVAFGGGGGGGAIVLSCDGKLSISGLVSARGGSSSRSVSGSGGSILLRALKGLVVSGRVDATGGNPGFVRIDSWRTAPVITGAITPKPTTLTLPELRNRSPLAKIGYAPFRVHAGANAIDFLGSGVAMLADIDKDGYAELLVGVPGSDVNGTNSGSVIVYSGKSGKVLRQVNGAAAGYGLGRRVAAIGDVNLDGVPDFAASYLGSATSARPGAVYAYSGKDGKQLWVAHGVSARGYFGRSLDAAGDVDKDGRPDVIAGGDGESPNGSNSGQARVLSGKDGKTIWTFNGTSKSQQHGLAVAGIGDVNADGYADLAVSSYYNSFPGKNSGWVVVYSGRSGKQLYVVREDKSRDRFGQSLARLGDVDGDRVPDFVVGVTGWLWTAKGSTGRVQVISGKTGKTIWFRNGDSPKGQFGHAVARIGDVTGDKVPDLVVSAYLDRTSAMSGGSVSFLSGKDGSRFAHLRGGLRDKYGLSLAGGEDIDADGKVDVAIGAQHAPGKSRYEGRVDLYSGLPTPTKLDAKIVLSSAGIPGNWISYYLAFKPANITIPGLGVLKLDPLTGFQFAALSYAKTGDDPILDLTIPVPNSPSLVGLRVHFQGLAINFGKAAWLGNRLTNDVVLKIGM